MDSVAIVQAENIEFMSGPDITIDASIGTAAGSLAEKTNIASDFKAHTVTLDLSKDFVADDQTLFWQIDAPGGAGKASAADFLHTTGYVDVAKGTSTAAVTGAASFDIFVRNDGDADEAAETFDIKIGYVIGDNKAEQIEIGLPDTSAGAVATAFSGTAAVLDLDEADTTKADSYSANVYSSFGYFVRWYNNSRFCFNAHNNWYVWNRREDYKCYVGTAANLTL